MINKNLDGSDITFEQDGKLSFNEEEHIYSLGGVEFSSVSNIVSKFFREFDALSISLKKCYGNELEAAKLREVWESKGSVASQAGTFLHKQIEDYLNGKEIPDLLCDVCYQGNYVKCSQRLDISREWSYFKAFERNTPFVPFRTEWRTYDADARMAGTLDLYVHVPTAHTRFTTGNEATRLIRQSVIPGQTVSTALSILLTPPIATIVFSRTSTVICCRRTMA